MTNTDAAPARTPLISKIKGLGDAGDFRTWISAVVVLGFFAAYVLNWWRNDTKALDLMNGALIAQFTGAVGYWLGSSRGSDAKTAVMSSQLVDKDPAQ